jgi:adenylate cyclase
LNVPRKTEVKGVVNAALEMQEFILKRFEDRKNSEQPAFEMRLGIHTGPVVAGIVGIKKFQYDIWGDTVNTANRMESNGAAGKVNISQASYKILKEDSDYTFESRGELEVKGKGKMQMWFISKI